MAAVVPVFMQGENVAVVKIRRQSRAANGALTDAGSDISILTVWDDIQKAKRTITKEVNAAVPREHNIRLMDTFSFSFRYYIVHNGSDPDPIDTAYVADSTHIFKITLTIGTSTGSIATDVAYAVLTSHEHTGNGRNEWHGAVSFVPVDPGAADYFVRTVS